MPLNSHRLNRSPHYAKYARDIGNIPKQMVSIYQHSIADYSNIRQCYSNTHFLIPPLGKRKQTVTQKSSIFIPQMGWLPRVLPGPDQAHLNQRSWSSANPGSWKGENARMLKSSCLPLVYVGAVPFAFCALWFWCPVCFLCFLVNMLYSTSQFLHS